MKKALALLLTAALAAASVTTASADNNTDTAAVTAAAFPVSYDSRESNADRPDIAFSPAYWQSQAVASDASEGFAGDSVRFGNSADAVRLTVAQKAFILARRADLTEAVWFSMNDGTSSLGTPQQRVKEALLNGGIVLLGDNYEILGWNDETTVEVKSDETSVTTDEGTAETASDADPLTKDVNLDEASAAGVRQDESAASPEPAESTEAPDITNSESVEEGGEPTFNGEPLMTAPEKSEETPNQKADIGTAAEPDAAGDNSETDSETEAASEDKGDAGSAAESEDKGDAGSAAESEDKGDAGSAAESEDKGDVGSAAESEDNTGCGPEAKSDDETATKSDDETATKADDEQGAVLEPGPETGIAADTEAEPGDSAETVIKQGGWHVRDLTTGDVFDLLYDDHKVMAEEVLCLQFADKNVIRTLYRTDGGIADGRLVKDDQTEDVTEGGARDDDGSEETVAANPGRWMAKVFTAAHDESLTEISFYTDKLHTNYEIQVSLGGVSGKAAFNEPLKGKVTGAGFHTVKLPESVALTEGTKFAVCLRFANETTALFYDTTNTVYDEAGREIWTSVSSADSSTQMISVDGITWQELDPDGSGDWRIGAVTDFDPDDILMSDTAEPISDGNVYVIHCAGNKGYALDVTGGSVIIRTNIQAHTTNGTVAQKWFAVKNSDGTWSFVSYMAGRALDVEGNGSAYKTNVQLHTPRFKDSQRFRIIDAGDGSYFIQHADSGCYLDVSGGKYKNGANIQIYKPNRTAAQKFTFEAIQVKDFSGEYSIAMSSANRMVLAAAGAATNDGANIELQAFTKADSQIFTLTRISGSYYSVINKNSGMALTIHSSASAGKNIKQAAYRGSDLQIWRVVANDDGTFSFFSKALNNISLDIAGAKTADGTNVRVNSYSKGAHQRFYLKDPNRGELDGTFVVRSALYPDRVLDVSGASVDVGANIQSHNNNWTEAQQFVFKKVSTATNNPIYYITNKKSGKMLAYSGTLANDANVVQDTEARTDAHKWYITTNADGTYTISPNQNRALALDIASASIVYKTNVRVHKSNNTPAQKWYLSSHRITKCVLSASDRVQVTGTSGGIVGDDYRIYLFAFNPTNYILGSMSPLASTTDGTNFTVTSSALNMENYINQEFFTGIKINGKYHITSNGMYITNPEKASSNSTPRITPLNKKGMALSSYSDAFIDEVINTLHIKHAAMNIPLAAFVTSQNVSFSYQGQTYHYVNMEGYKSIVRRLNAAGIQVTGIIYADRSLLSGYTDYITPTGRSAPSSAALLGMNASEPVGRAKLEAAFTYLAKEFSSQGCQIDNWVIGNELDNPVNWNYCGDSLPIDQYVTLYTQVYRLAFNAMKRVWANVRVYDSLDSVWNVTGRGPQYYTARSFQDTFHSVLSGEGEIAWGLAYHPYCAPELDPRIWAHPTYATSDGATTPRITLDNIKALPQYVNEKYGSGHPIILSETGINYRYQGVDMPNEQAAAIAYGYYNVESASGIDNLIIHNEAGPDLNSWQLGIYNNNGSRRPSYYVFANMDGARGATQYTTQNIYGSYTLLQIVAIGKGIPNVSKWSQVIPGINMSKFLDQRY